MLGVKIISVVAYVGAVAFLVFGLALIATSNDALPVKHIGTEIPVYVPDLPVLPTREPFPVTGHLERRYGASCGNLGRTDVWCVGRVWDVFVQDTP